MLPQKKCSILRSRLLMLRFLHLRWPHFASVTGALSLEAGGMSGAIDFVSSVPVKGAQESRQDLNKEALSHTISRSMSALVAQQHAQLRKLEEAEPWCGYTKRNCRSFAENAMVKVSNTHSANASALR
jgi:hypothetical protein